MSQSDMKEALKRRRGKSVDIAIVLGGHPGESDSKPEEGLGDPEDASDSDVKDETSEDLGLAPDVEDADTHLNEQDPPEREAVAGDKFAVDEELGDPSDHPEADGAPAMSGTKGIPLGGAPKGPMHKGSSQAMQHMGKLIGSSGHGLRSRAFNTHVKGGNAPKSPLLKKHPIMGPKKV